MHTLSHTGACKMSGSIHSCNTALSAAQRDPGRAACKLRGSCAAPGMSHQQIWQLAARHASMQAGWHALIGQSGMHLHGRCKRCSWAYAQVLNP